MKRFLFWIYLLSVIFFACTTATKSTDLNVAEKSEITTVEPKVEKPKEIEKPKPVIKTPKKEEPITKLEEEVVATFGEIKITKKDYVDTKSEIEFVVDELNEITKTKKYDKWLNYLSKEYFEYFSQSNVLKSVSEQLPIKGIKLNSLKDYFNYVFVPSRKNIRVDDITFTSPKKVNVIMRNNGVKLLIYSLEKQNENWKLTQNQQ